MHFGSLSLDTDEFHDWKWDRGQIVRAPNAQPFDPPHRLVRFGHDVARFLARYNRHRLG